MDYGKRKLRLGDVLVNSGVITQKKLEQALGVQKGTGKRLGEVMVDSGFATEEQIAQALSEQLHYSLIDLSTVKISDDVLDLVPITILKKYSVLPFEFDKNNANVIRVAMADPMDMLAIDDISIVTNLQVEPVVCTLKSVNVAIDKYFGQDEVLTAVDQYAKEKEEQMAEEEDMYSEDVNNSPIVQLERKSVV